MVQTYKHLGALNDPVGGMKKEFKARAFAAHVTTVRIARPVLTNPLLGICVKRSPVDSLNAYLATITKSTNTFYIERVYSIQ